MCSNIIINKQLYSCIGDLKKIIPNIPFINGYNIMEENLDDCCLCSIDIQKLANMINSTITYDGMDYYDENSTPKLDINFYNKKFIPSGE